LSSSDDELFISHVLINRVQKKGEEKKKKGEKKQGPKTRKRT
jgi:hypothetical protein